MDKQFRKKPVVISAEQWNKNGDVEEAPIQPMDSDSDWKCSECGKRASEHANCKTLEGWHIVCPGDFIIQGIKGEYYPCKPDIFEATYDEVENESMTFGLAVEAMKKGLKVARIGWNGKGMFAVYQKGYPKGIPCNKQTAEAWGINEGDLFVVRPYLQLKCADGTHAMWTPSTSDVLADDWYIVE